MRISDWSSDVCSSDLKNAKDSAGGTQQVNAAAESTAENVQTVASAAQELTSSIDEIQRQVRAVQDVVERTRARPTQTQDQVPALADPVAKNGSVVPTHNSIPPQTHLLPHNAPHTAGPTGNDANGLPYPAAPAQRTATP